MPKQKQSDQPQVGKGVVRIGISGWRYAPWRGHFYPKGLTQASELDYASRVLATIEINGSFYSLQTPTSYEKWARSTPAGFIFSVKAPRYITHMLRLRNIKTPLANFFASGIFRLGPKLGPILWQFPPNFRFDPPLFESFLDQLPQDWKSAQALARRRDARMHGRAALAIDINRAMRHAVEIRHDSFMDQRFSDMLRKRNVSLVVADSAGLFPYLEEITADFMYLRLHGEEELYASGYGLAALKHWKRRIMAWTAGGEPRDACRISANRPEKKPRDVYCYFDNDRKVHAPFDAQKLAGLLAGEETADHTQTSRKVKSSAGVRNTRSAAVRRSSFLTKTERPSAPSSRKASSSVRSSPT